MDRVGADFFRVVSEIKEKLGANPVPMQIPIGSEEHFPGVIDLIERRAISGLKMRPMGMKYEYTDIPEDLIEETEQVEGKPGRSSL